VRSTSRLGGDKAAGDQGRRIGIPFTHCGKTADPVRSGGCWPKGSPATSWGSGTVWLSMASMTGCAICNSPGGANRRHLPRHDHRGGTRGGRATAGGSQHRHRRRGGRHLWPDPALRPHPRQFLKIKARTPRPSCAPIFAASRRCAEPGMWYGSMPTPGAFRQIFHIGLEFIPVGSHLAQAARNWRGSRTVETVNLDRVTRPDDAEPDRAAVNEIISRLSQKIGGCPLQVGQVPSGSLLTQPRTAVSPSRPSIKVTQHRSGVGPVNAGQPRVSTAVCT